MDGRPKLADEPTWQKLQQYYNNNGSKINIHGLMKNNPNRFDNFRQVFWLLLRSLLFEHGTLEMTLVNVFHVIG
jgi:hypothetical protein